MGLEEVEKNNIFFCKIAEFLKKYPAILQFMRYSAIGLLNTAIDFFVLNFLSKYYGIDKGFLLGGVNIPGFVLAVCQSYVWNKYWAFGEARGNLGIFSALKELSAMSFLGLAGVGLCMFGALRMEPASFYFWGFGLFVSLQIFLAYWFKIFKKSTVSKNYFKSFLLVSLGGLFLNTSFVSIFSSFHLSLNLDLNKNLAKILAMGFSIAWNFFGYKKLVFKR